MKKIKNLFRVSKKTVFIALVLVLVVLVSGYLLSRDQHNNRKPVASDDRRGVNDINYDPPTKEELDETKRQKDQIIKDYEESLNPPEQPASIGVTITRASQTVTGQPLNIRTIIDGVTSGTCEVTLQREGQPTVAKTFNIGLEGTYATCQQADIPAVEFAEAGDWSLEIIAKSGNVNSPVISQNVTIMK